MFAVREEVNAIKARIGELTARNAQLESENTLLRQHASPETLDSLQRTCTSGRSTEPGTPTPKN